MVDEGSSQPSVSLSELSGLRAQTEAISKQLSERLERHFEVLRTLTAPRRMLGKYMGGSASRDDVAGADKTVEALEKIYKKVAGAPFVLKPKLDHAAFKLIDSKVELYPWEYSHEASHGGDSNTIEIRSPVRWVANYASDYTLHDVREVLAGREEKRNDDMLQFVLNALVLRAVLDKFPAVVQLLADLRFEVSFETAPGLGELELVVLSAHLPSFLPPDELILTATGVSGVNAFIELIHKDAVEGLTDPMREDLEKALG